MLDLPSLGKHISRRRSAAGMTQAELAERAGVGRSTLDALENGRTTELGYGKIARILAALSLDLSLVEARRLRPTLDTLRDEHD